MSEGQPAPRRMVEMFTYTSSLERYVHHTEYIISKNPSLAPNTHISALFLLEQANLARIQVRRQVSLALVFFD